MLQERPLRELEQHFHPATSPFQLPSHVEAVKCAVPEHWFCGHDLPVGTEDDGFLPELCLVTEIKTNTKKIFNSVFKIYLSVLIFFFFIRIENRERIRHFTSSEFSAVGVPGLRHWGTLLTVESDWFRLSRSWLSSSSASRSDGLLEKKMFLQLR